MFLVVLQCGMGPGHRKEGKQKLGGGAGFQPALHHHILKQKSKKLGNLNLKFKFRLLGYKESIHVNVKH